MNFISTRNSKKSAKELMFGVNAFIHRRNMGDKVRFNPAFKSFIGDKGVGFTMDKIEGESKVFIAIDHKHAWKVSKGSNMKASNLTELLDDVYDTKTNRYSLVYHDTNEHGDIFVIEPQEVVDEREVSDEMREAARERFSEFWNKKKSNPDQSELNFDSESESNVQSSTESNSDDDSIISID